MTTYPFQDINGLTGFLKVLLVLGVVLAVASGFSSFLQADLLSSRNFTEAEAEANDSRQLAIGLAHLGLYLVTVIVFARWIIRANKNVRALGAVGLPTTPGWAVGYVFVPILHFWKPYQAMKDLWRASHSPTSWATTAAGAILPAW